METEYDDPYQTVRQGGDNASNANVINVDAGKHIAVVAICSALCGMSAVLAGWAAFQAAYATKRADMLQYYVMELDGKLMAADVIKYEESWAAQQRKPQEK